MAIQNVLLVDEEALTRMKDELSELINKAIDVTETSKFDKIRQAQYALYEARGIFTTLNRMDLLLSFNVSMDDIERIERKHMSILEAKRRSDYPKWRS